MVRYLPVTSQQVRNGYTLIELLVVAAIIGLLTGAGVASYARFNQRQQVEQAAMYFANQLRLTQKRADAGERVDGCTDGEKLLGYQVSAIAGNSSASIDAFCGPVASPTVNAGSITLPGTNTFMDGFDVTFKTVAGGVQVTDGEVTIEDAAGRYQYKIAVEAGGIITVEKI